MTTSPSPWLPTPARPDARVRLFCLPYAGGGATVFYPWTREVPPSVQVCPVHLPGRENRTTEPAISSLTSLVDQLTRELSPWLSTPFALFGHSLGALVAFELTRLLRKTGAAPVHLFVSASRAPQRPARAPLYHLPDADFLTAVQQRYQALPDVVVRDPELLQLFLPVLRTDFTLFDTYAYRAEEPLACPVSVFGGEQDREVSPDALSAWQQQTTAPFRLRLFPGDHFFLKPQRTSLVRAVVEDLAPWL